jgi:lipoprotein-releasing system permease protein
VSDRGLRGWMIFTAARFLSSPGTRQGRIPTILSIAGIGVGVMALIVVLSVMNGFQLGFIEDILEVRSYHLRITVEGELEPALLQAIREERLVNALVPFRETQTLIAGGYDGHEPVVLRGVDETAISGDDGFLRQIEIVAGEYDVHTTKSIILGSELADSIGAAVGTPVRIVSLKGTFSRGFRPVTELYMVTGLFRSGYYEIDSVMAFCSLETIELVSPGDGTTTYGVKLSQRFRDREAIDSLDRILATTHPTIESWREFNRAFFGALRTEKLTMTLLLGLIFVVVAFNIAHTMQRSVTEKRESIAVLKALGGTPQEVRGVFILQGGIIGTTGSLLGVAVGLLVSTRIDSVFAGIERITNALVRLAQLLFTGGASRASDLSFFSPSFFYLSRVPVRIVPGEVFAAVAFAISVSLFAAFFSSSRTSEIEPQRVLRYE